MGVQVAGSYENEVSAVRVLVEAVREIARVASPHNRVELELHSASGAFPLDFLDGEHAPREHALREHALREHALRGHAPREHALREHTSDGRRVRLQV